MIKYLYNVYEGEKEIIHSKGKAEIINALGITEPQFKRALTYGTQINRKYSLERCNSTESLAAKVNDQLVVDILNGGGDYETVAEKLGMKDKLNFIKQYCHDRGYTLKNRGKIEVCNNPREYLSGYYKPCKVCGVMFSCMDPETWVYKKRTKSGSYDYYHSYTCFRKEDLEREKNRKSKHNLDDRTS